MRIPSDHPVQPCHPSTPGAATCGTCGRSWDDATPTGWTPAPSGRCPFEEFHPEDEPEESEGDRLRSVIRDLLRECVTPSGVPDKGRGRTAAQGRAIAAALAALR